MIDETMLIRDINFFTTYKCNSRCLNCNIWKSASDNVSKETLNETDLKRLFEDDLLKQCHNVGLAGGEPTISSFFWDLLDLIPVDKRITITTNALNSKRLVEYLAGVKERDRFLIQVSLDGIGPTNDLIRGVPGAFNKTTTLLEQLKKLNVPRLISFTINHQNYSEIADCYDLAQKNKALFSTRMAYCGGAYANADSQKLFSFAEHELTQLEQLIQHIIEKELTKDNHHPPQLVFMKKMVDYYRGNQNDLPCYALDTGVVIDLYGDLFPTCPVMMKSIGNLKQNTLSEIWKGQKADRLRKQIKAHSCGGCWNDCQVVTNITFDQDLLSSVYTSLKLKQIDHAQKPDCIDFNSDPSTLILSGWHPLDGVPEFKYRWTALTFSLAVPGGVNGIVFHAKPYYENPSDYPLRLTARAQGEILGDIELTDHEWSHFEIQFLKPLTRLTVCHFEVRRSVSAVKKGIAKDLHQLGLAVQKMTFGYFS